MTRGAVRGVMGAGSKTMLRHYRLDEVIGEGGMGVVWRAHDTRLDRDVAIKILAAGVDQPRCSGRLEAEARALARLQHENIVAAHAVERDAEGQTFLVMELIEGASLDRQIPDGGLDLGRVLDIGIALADALNAAHARRILHGDVKPANVMVEPTGRPRLLDFGLARPTRSAPTSPDSEAVTRPYVADAPSAGTLPYMSPEQVRGEATDARSDIFSLGGTLYEMAAGRPPFAGDTDAELAASILRDDPPSLIESRPDLPRQLQRILSHALHKAPAHRFQTAADLRNELEALREELRHVDHAGAARIHSLAVLPLEDLGADPTQAWFTDGMTDALIQRLGTLGAVRVLSRTSVMRYRGVRRPLRDIARELSADAILEGTVLRAGSRVRITVRLVDADRDELLWSDSYDRDVQDVLILQSEVARAVAERIEVQLTPLEDERLARAAPVDPDVQEAMLKGRHFWYRRTTASVRKALRYFRAAAQLDPGHAPAYAGIADAHIVDGGRYLGVTPEVAYGEARAAARRAVQLDDGLAEAHTSLAAVSTDYDWDWEAAEREYRRAIELNPSYATAHSWYAEHLSRMGRHDEAVAEAERARRLDPISRVSSMIVAWILYFARRYDDAIREGRRVLELEHDYATAHRILGWAYEETERFEAAIAAHRRAADLTDDEPNFTGQLARAYALAGREGRARAVIDDLIARRRKAYVSALDIAIAYAALGDTDPALDWLERARDERADHLPYLAVNPRVDGLREEPRFRAVLQSMGLGGG